MLVKHILRRLHKILSICFRKWGFADLFNDYNFLDCWHDFPLSFHLSLSLCLSLTFPPFFSFLLAVASKKGQKTWKCKALKDEILYCDDGSPFLPILLNHMYVKFGKKNGRGLPLQKHEGREGSTDSRQPAMLDDVHKNSGQTLHQPVRSFLSLRTSTANPGAFLSLSEQPWPSLDLRGLLNKTKT